MLLIWGFKSYASVLATMSLVCPRCQNPAAHRLHQVVRKFTFFWIPLFTTKRLYHLDCTFCGLQRELTREQADEVQRRLQDAPPAVPPTAQPTFPPTTQPTAQPTFPPPPGPPPSEPPPGWRA